MTSQYLNHKRGIRLLTVILQFLLGAIISLPEAPRQLLKGPGCWLIAGWGFRKSIFFSRGLSLTHQPGTFHRLLLPVSSPRGIRSMGEVKRASLCGVDAECLSLCQERARFSRGPCTPQSASLLVGAKRDRGNGVLLGPRGHAALRPPGPLDFSCHMIIHDPHEQGFGWGCGVPRRISGGSICTAARNSLFSW